MRKFYCFFDLASAYHALHILLHLRKVMAPERNPVTSVWSFPKLTGQNYFTWSEQMKAALQACYLWQYVTGDEPKPPKPPASPPVPTTKATVASTLSESPAPLKPSATAELDEDGDAFFYSPNYICWEKGWECYCTWVQSNGATMGLIKGAIDPFQWGHVSRAVTLKDMWGQLYQLHFVTR